MFEWCLCLHKMKQRNVDARTIILNWTRNYSSVNEHQLIGDRRAAIDNLLELEPEISVVVVGLVAEFGWEDGPCPASWIASNKL